MLLGARQFFERRGAPAWTNPYVTDGLVAMWDGEWNAGGGVHDENATAWKDLVGTLDATFSSGTPTWTTNEWNGYSGDFWITSVNDSLKAAIENGNFSAEFVIGSKGQSVNEKGIIQIGTTMGQPALSAKKNLGTNTAFNVFIRGTAIGGLNSYGNEETSFSISTSGTTCSVFNNGIAVKTSSIPNSFTLSDTGMWIGKYNVAYSLTLRGGLHSIRLYTRALTAAEIAANYAIDKARFNLP